MSESSFSLLKRNINYRYLYSSTALSFFGDWFSFLAIIALLAEVGGVKPSSIGYVLIIKQLPIFLLAPIAGVIGDKFNRASIMSYSNFMRVLCTCLLLIPAFHSSSLLVYFCLLMQTSCTAFFEPARSALIPDIVEAKDFTKANALASLLWSSMLILGSALGGIATDIFGWRSALILDAISYIIAGILASRIKPNLKVVTSADRVGEQIISAKPGGLREFLDYLYSHPKLFVISLIKPVFGFGGAVYLLMTLLGQQYYGLGRSGVLGVSLLYIARGIGALCGPFLIRNIFSESTKNFRLFVFYGQTFAAVFYIALSLTNDWRFGCLWVLLAHLSSSILWVYSTLLMQLESRTELRARSFAFEMGGFTLTSSLSILIYGYLLDHSIITVPQAAFIIGAIWIVPSTLWLLIHRAWKE